MALALDENHDLSRGDRSTISLALLSDEVVQGLLTRLKLFLGEWNLDADAGTDWFGVVFVDRPDIRLVESELRRQILSQPGVQEITRFDLTNYDRGLRALVLDFEVSTIYGASGAIQVTL